MRRYIGIPYEPFGRTFSGCDCWGLVLLYYRRELGIELPAYTNKYTDVNNTIEIASVMEAEKCNWHRAKEPKRGAVVHFRIMGHPAHVGIMLGDSAFLHTISGQNSSIEDLHDDKWARRLEGWYEWRPQ